MSKFGDLNLLFKSLFVFTGRFQAAVTSFQGKIWAVGGCDGWNPLNSVEVYDPSTNTWKIGPALTAPRRGCGLAVRNGASISLLNP